MYNSGETQSFQVLLRLVDDYLLITTNYLKARTFLEMMMKGGSFPRRDLLATKLLHIIQGILNMAVSSHQKRQELTSILGLTRRWSRNPTRKVGRLTNPLPSSAHSIVGFPWCGYAINMDDLSVMADYSRYPSTCMYPTEKGS